ncbi:MAG TPA: hypothetical protein PK926_00135 [Spirochaetota bacterium]|nr:hypothetical protein [Spirochaetota bacterium]HPI88999.1 hypothetical protein [Spirochaetota bacterium]HPR47486.1 hypothetical protein [Spirochaetota bacterium]
MTKCSAIIIFTFILILSSLVPLAASNPLFKTGKQSHFINKEKTDADLYPPYIGGFLHFINIKQKEINASLALSIKKIEQGSHAEIMLFVFFSFLYGIIHSLGPGHGKSLISSYFLTEEARIRKALVAGPMIALLHGMSAVVVVGALYCIFKGSLLVNF